MNITHLYEKGVCNYSHYVHCGIGVTILSLSVAVIFEVEDLPLLRLVLPICSDGQQQQSRLGQTYQEACDGG